MKASELRVKPREELMKELIALRKEQFNLRMQRGAGQLANPARFRFVQKDIARIKTILNERPGTHDPARAEAQSGINQ